MSEIRYEEDKIFRVFEDGQEIEITADEVKEIMESWITRLKIKGYENE